MLAERIAAVVAIGGGGPQQLAAPIVVGRIGVEPEDPPAAQQLPQTVNRVRPVVDRLQDGVEAPVILAVCARSVGNDAQPLMALVVAAGDIRHPLDHRPGEGLARGVFDGERLHQLGSQLVEIGIGERVTEEQDRRGGQQGAQRGEIRRVAVQAVAVLGAGQHQRAGIVEPAVKLHDDGFGVPGRLGERRQVQGDPGNRLAPGRGGAARPQELAVGVRRRGHARQQGIEVGGDDRPERDTPQMLEAQPHRLGQGLFAHGLGQALAEGLLAQGIEEELRRHFQLPGRGSRMGVEEREHELPLAFPRTEGRIARQVADQLLPLREAGRRRETRPHEGHAVAFPDGVHQPRVDLGHVGTRFAVGCCRDRFVHFG